MTLTIKGFPFQETSDFVDAHLLVSDPEGVYPSLHECVATVFQLNFPFTGWVLYSTLPFCRFIDGHLSGSATICSTSF